MKPYVEPVKAGLARLQDATMWLAQNGMKNPDNAGAASVDYLRMFGIVVVGYLWARQAAVAKAKLASGQGNKAFYDMVVSTIPFGRMGRPEEVANAIVFLASQKASWVSGVTLPVDGVQHKGNF